MIMKEGLTVAFILLFICLAFAPSINANISKTSIDSELVEITTEVCGINGVTPNTVSLSKEDAEEVDRLFDSIKEKLDKVETREDTEQIFNEAVVELDKYGLLGRLSVKQAQKLVTGRFQNLRISRLIDKITEKNDNSLTNFNCTIIGHITQNCAFIRPAIPELGLFVRLLYMTLYLKGTMPHYIIAPAFLRFDIGLGVAGWSMESSDWDYEGAKGSITTVGELGRKNMSGVIWGNISKTRELDLGRYFGTWIYYVGIKRFKGFRIYDMENFDNYYFLGFAKEVRLDSELPG